jgi:hypothetical protein
MGFSSTAGAAASGMGFAIRFPSTPARVAGIAETPMSIGSIINSHVTRLPVITAKPLPSASGATAAAATPQPATATTVQSSPPVSPVSNQVMSVLLSTQNDPTDASDASTPAAANAQTAANTTTQTPAAITLDQAANGQGTTIGSSAAPQQLHHHHHHAGAISQSQNDSDPSDNADATDSTDAFGASTDSSGSDTMSTIASVLDTLQGAATIAALA